MRKHLAVSVFTAVTLLPSTSWARDVRLVHLGINKKGPYGVINAGSAEGFLVGDEVCLQSQDGTELACQVIVKTKKHAAAMQFTTAQRQQLDVGLQAYPQGSKPDETATLDLSESQEDSAAQQADEDIRALALETAQDKPSKPLAWQRPHRLGLGYTYTGKTPLSYQFVTFDPNARGLGSSEIWNKTNRLESSPIGITISYEMPWSGRWSLGLRAAYDFLPKVSKTTDYDPADPSQFVDSSLVAHTYYLGADAGFGLWQRGPLQLAARAGLDIIYAQARYQALQKTDANSSDNLANLKLTTTAWMPRLGTELVYLWGPINFSGALSLTKAVTPSTDAAGTVGDLGGSRNASQEKDELSKAIGPKASPWSWSVSLAVGWLLTQR